jgi:hypothetical protein
MTLTNSAMLMTHMCSACMARFLAQERLPITRGTEPTRSSLNAWWSAERPFLDYSFSSLLQAAPEWHHACYWRKLLGGKCIEGGIEIRPLEDAAVTSPKLFYLSMK